MIEGTIFATNAKVGLVLKSGDLDQPYTFNLRRLRPLHWRPERGERVLFSCRDHNVIVVKPAVQPLEGIVTRIGSRQAQLTRFATLRSHETRAVTYKFLQWRACTAAYARAIEMGDRVKYWARPGPDPDHPEIFAVEFVGREKCPTSIEGDATCEEL